MKNRRELLACFGVGAVIVPIIGGVPEDAAVAQLIEIPKVELITAQPGNGALSMDRIKTVTVTFENRDGSRRSIHGWLDSAEGRIEPGSNKLLTLTISHPDYSTSPAYHLREATMRATTGPFL